MKTSGAETENSPLCLGRMINDIKTERFKSKHNIFLTLQSTECEGGETKPH